MGDKEQKALLKEARDLIKAKDFKGALREVKKVLNKDKNNYMGLVFCALCLSELDQPEQALQVEGNVLHQTFADNFNLFAPIFFLQKFLLHM